MTPRPMMILVLAAGLLTGCSKKAADVPAAPSSDAAAAGAPSNAGFTDQADCAGAYAAVGGIDPGSVQQNTASPAFVRYARMLSASINATTSATASDAGAVVVRRAGYWKARPAADQAARAGACQSKYGF